MTVMDINRILDNALWELAKKHDTGHIDTCDVKTIVQQVHDILLEGSVTMSNQLITERLSNIRSYRNQLARLMEMPQVEQRSPEWHDMRKNRLTASDTAAAMGRGKFETRKGLLKKKAFPELSPFVSSPIMKWGTMFEPIALRSYRQRNGDITCHEFGLVPHPTVDHYGASPDGISELGIMLEFKCPPKRKIDGTIPEQYEIQMQGQLAVCGLRECDYVECGLEDLHTSEEYIEMVSDTSRTDHGIVLEYCDNAVMTYDYSPEYMTPAEAWKWAQERIKNEQRHLVKITPWRLKEYFTQRVYFDPDRWVGILQQVSEFWKEVEDMRFKGSEAYIVEKPQQKRRERFNKVIEFIDDDDNDDTTGASSDSCFSNSL